MSSGAFRKAFPARTRVRPLRSGATVRFVPRADLGGGTLISARFSAPWNAIGTLMARLEAPSRHSTSVRTASDKPPPDGSSRGCSSRVCARHAVSFHTRRSDAVPKACPKRAPASQNLGTATSQVDWSLNVARSPVSWVACASSFEIWRLLFPLISE